MFEKMFKKRELKRIQDLDARANAQLTRLSCARKSREFDVHEYVRYWDMIKELSDLVTAYKKAYPRDLHDIEDIFSNVKPMLTAARDEINARLQDWA